ncbi:hypothetical protein QUA86_11500 [Microcoleus sp. F6_B6]
MKFFATGAETGFFGASLFERLCVSCDCVFSCDRAATTNTAIAKSFRGGFRITKAVCSIAGVFYSAFAIAPMVKIARPCLRHK